MTNLLKNKLIRFLPAFLWMCFIFYLSSGQTTAITGTTVERFIILKTFHLIEYGVLFILLNWGGLTSKKAILFAYLFAVSDEFHQSFVPGRTPMLRDTYIDLGGSSIAYTITQLTVVKKHFRIK